MRMGVALLLSAGTLGALALARSWTPRPTATAAPGKTTAAPPARPRRSWTTPKTGARYAKLFQDVEARYGFPAGLISRVAWQESRYNPQAVSRVGARGMFQFMPATAAEWGLTDPFDPQASAWAAGAYLSRLYDRFGDWVSALAAYNWGQGNVRKGLTNAPAETRTYVVSILTDIGLIDP